tara:strand:+ start:533 stop:676 length:144 start_codon:yes stop_codon:yes gene_type:complete
LHENNLPKLKRTELFKHFKNLADKKIKSELKKGIKKAAAPTKLGSAA